MEPFTYNELGLCDDTSLDIEVFGNTTTCNISGDRTTILQVVEVLAWCGAACSAADGDYVAFCKPLVEYNQWSATNELLVRYERSTLDHIATPPMCWHLLLRNQAVADRYPILHRRDADGARGLETSLPVMRLLCQTDWMELVGHCIIYTGCKSIFYPTTITSWSVTWHFALTEDPSLAPHIALPLLFRLEGLADEDKLECLRRFVGWKSHAQVTAGKYEADNRASRFISFWASTSRYDFLTHLLNRKRRVRLRTY